jgi:hypothetical protein
MAPTKTIVYTNGDTYVIFPLNRKAQLEAAQELKRKTNQSFLLQASGLDDAINLEFIKLKNLVLSCTRADGTKASPAEISDDIQNFDALADWISSEATAFQKELDKAKAAAGKNS